MPDLGKYAAEVLSAYGATCVVLCVLVAATLWQGRKVRAERCKVGVASTPRLLWCT